MDLINGTRKLSIYLSVFWLDVLLISNTFYAERYEGKQNGLG